VADRSEPWIAALVLATSGLVLAAPVLGRIGYAGMADAAMALAAACGLASFLLVGVATLRAARSRPRAERETEDRSC
jgi:hypothetical protein